MNKNFVLLIIFIFLAPVLGSIPAGSGMIVINEVASTGKYDFIELYNTTSIDLKLDSDWKLTDKLESRMDNDPAILLPEGTIIPAGGYLLIAPYKTNGLLTKVPAEIPEFALAVRSFAVGSKDEISLFYNENLEDFISWQTDVNAIGRVEDGGSEISSLMIPTPNKSNELEIMFQGNAPLLLNEVCSRGLDYIEIINVSFNDMIVGKDEWKVEDSRKNDYVMIPEGTKIKAGEFLVIYPDVIRLPFSAPKEAIASSAGFRFGFGNSDSVYLKYHGMIVDYLTWSDHVTSIGRLPDGSEIIDFDMFLTPGKANRD